MGQNSDIQETEKKINVAKYSDILVFQDSLVEMLRDMFGEAAVPKSVTKDDFYVTVDDKKAIIDFYNLKVTCEEDLTLQKILQTAVSRLYNSLAPISAIQM